MKKSLALIALCFAAHAAAEHVEFKDTGSIVAIVCHEKADARKYVEFAGANDTAGFKTFVQDRMSATACRFLGSDASIDVLEHEVVFTDNGPLWVVKLRQKDVYGKYDHWWASANYFPTAYPKTASWEMDLIHAEQQAGK